MYALLNDDGSLQTYPYSFTNLRYDNKSVSFPDKLTKEILNDFKLATVAVSAIPKHTSRTETVTKNDVPTLIEGVWTISWTISEKSSEEVEAFDLKASIGVRARRELLLQETDFYALTDSPDMPDAMKEYRKKLRDISLQDGFPNNVTWPIKPV